MREVKLKAFVPSLNKIVEVVMVAFEHSIIHYKTENGNMAVQDKDLTLIQYTGLKDKNGREIYEGDILKTHNQNNIVKCEYGSFMLTGLHEDKYERTYAHLKDYLVDVTIPDVNGSRYDGVTVHLEIIGNIYENPELLEFEL